MIVSPGVNLTVDKPVCAVGAFVYAINNVAGSEPLAVTTSNTFAVTVLVAPVNVVPTREAGVPGSASDVVFNLINSYVR